MPREDFTALEQHSVEEIPESERIERGKSARGTIYSHDFCIVVIAPLNQQFDEQDSTSRTLTAITSRWRNLEHFAHEVKAHLPVIWDAWLC